MSGEPDPKLVAFAAEHAPELPECPLGGAAERRREERTRRAFDRAVAAQVSHQITRTAPGQREGNGRRR